MPPLPARGGGGPQADRPGRVLLLFVGALLTLALIAGTTFVLVSFLAHEESTANVSFPGPIRHLVLDLGHGAVTVRGGDRTGVSGTRVVSRGLNTPALDERVDGDTLTLHVSCPNVTPWCGVTYVLDVPRDVDVSGSISDDSFAATDLSGDISVQATAGEISLDRVSGTLDLGTHAGRVSATDVTSQQVTASTTAGVVSLSFAAPPRSVTTAARAGGIEIQVPNDGTPYRVDTGSSHHSVDVSVTIDRNAEHTITAIADPGSVQVHYAS
jgi:hypothetical protein